jgi:cobalt/nickel transport system permease protein
LAALLFLALTTPLTDLISLLRRCRLPETLLDLMTLCYRTLFVLSEAIHETITAQSARLGYSTVTISLRSLGGLIASLVAQVWQRSLALHLAAQARGNDGALRFLENSYPDSRRNIAIAATVGSLMVALAVILP